MSTAVEPLELLRRALLTVFNELVDGAASEACWVLNPRDPGLLRSLDRLSAEAASVVPPTGGASIAAHVEHLRYGFDLIVRYGRGEPDPFANADWSAAWRRTAVSEQEWAELRESLRAAARDWVDTAGRIGKTSELNSFEITGMLASVTHLAYHIGAIRQIDRSIRGPSAID